MSWLRTDRRSVAMRRQVVLDTLREHPVSTSSMISDAILNETGGVPTISTGALWVPQWTVYSDLLHHERAGRVERITYSARKVLWRVIADV